MYKYECDYCGDPLCPELCPESKQSKTTVWRQKCGYADKYKAISKPTCGCQACWNKWVETHQRGIF